MEQKDIDRFWAKVRKGKEDECWEWTISKCKGYGLIKFNGKTTRAHRLSWIIHFGDIPRGMFICHRCDNPSCVNPAHLFLGTNKDNMNDMVTKGRQGHTRGSFCNKKKLTEADIPVIRARISNGDRNIDIARDYGVSNKTICHIKCGRAWSWLKP